jgi:hypothetical protein
MYTDHLSLSHSRCGHNPVLLRSCLREGQHRGILHFYPGFLRSHSQQRSGCSKLAPIRPMHTLHTRRTQHYGLKSLLIYIRRLECPPICAQDLWLGLCSIQCHRPSYRRGLIRFRPRTFGDPSWKQHDDLRRVRVHGSEHHDDGECHLRGDRTDL